VKENGDAAGIDETGTLAALMAGGVTLVALMAGGSFDATACMA